MFYKGENIYVSFLAHQPLSKRQIDPNGKNLLLRGITFFSCRTDPFSEGSKSNFDRVVFPESVSNPPYKLPFFIHTLQERYSSCIEGTYGGILTFYWKQIESWRLRRLQTFIELFL